MVDLLLVGIVAGVLGTLTMDLLNLLLAKTGVITTIDHRMIGRAAYGWIRGRFVYADPRLLSRVRHELAYGLAAHYLIGVCLALVYLVGWKLVLGGAPSSAGAVLYGVATTAAAYLLLFPSIGLGLFGRRSPQGIKLPLSSLTNHLFYGVGIALVLMVGGRVPLAS